jgi:uncharacterized membrane protein
MTTERVAEQAVAGAGDQTAGVIFRDIVRGGIAGVITGAIVGGIGGRVVMRLAFLVVPGSAGSATENGNIIGQITLPGTLGLVVFGAIVGLFVGASWVALAPWIPGRGWSRALATVPLAIALGGVVLVDGTNADFAVLEHAPLVVAILLVLVGLSGFVVALTDERLDRVLPGVENGSAGRIAVYGILAMIGGVLTLPLLLGPVSESGRPRLGLVLAFLVVGGATIVWWRLRSQGQSSPPRALLLVARAGLVAMMILGTVDLTPEISQTIGAP